MISLKPELARRLLVAHLGLARSLGRGPRGTRAVLERLRCIQLDPLDVIGTNADLVVMARTDGVRRGDVWRHLFPDHAFEHFAKERCILPSSAFPYYREMGHKAQAPWWRHREREERVPAAQIEAVLAEVRERGPVAARDLTDHGSVKPIDWSGWMGTAKATSMALEILWTRCDVVVAGRNGSGAKLYTIPKWSGTPAEPFHRWAVRERVRAAGLLARASGPTWCILDTARKSGIVDEMVRDGELVDVTIEGSSRPYLAVPSFLAQKRISFDDRIRILGPLDPLLWDRKLVEHVFDFEYAWEVYKPAAQRRWGWYVCPLLHRDRLIGRFDAQTGRVWKESRDVDRKAIDAALKAHAS
jgi:uncharacterized protein YcaQ